jgi:hypothetical protein
MNTPHKTFAGDAPMKTFSGGVGTAKVFSSTGVSVCACAMDATGTPGLYRPRNGVYTGAVLPSAHMCSRDDEGELQCRR